MSFLPAIPAALSWASAGFSAVGAIADTVEARNVAAYNRRMYEQQAEDARRAAARDAERATEEGERTIGRAGAIAGASGFTLGGSAADIVGDLAGQQRYDTRALIYAGDLERRNYLAQATIERRRGRAATLRGAFRVGNAILNGGYNASRAAANG